MRNRTGGASGSEIEYTKHQQTWANNFTQELRDFVAADEVRTALTFRVPPVNNPVIADPWDAGATIRSALAERPTEATT
jgi:hypothetical protein